jgi:hypothetical protein
VPKGPALEHKGETDRSLAKKLDPLFARLWQLSKARGSDIRDAADAIERALIEKGIVQPSERQLDSKAYLARLKAKEASKSDGADAEASQEAGSQ